MLLNAVADWVKGLSPHDVPLSCLDGSKEEGQDNKCPDDGETCGLDDPHLNVTLTHSL